MLSVLPFPEISNSYTHRPHTWHNSHLSSTGRNVINTMPPEVLGEIFLKLLEDDDVGPHESNRPLVSYACQSDPMLFGHICSYWRSVALHTPKLWCRIHVLEPQKSHTQVIRLWLERAQTHPLDITFWEAGGGHDRAASRDIASLFLERRQYWRKICLTIGAETAKIFSAVAPSDFCLENLEFATLSVLKPRRRDNIDNFPNIVDALWRNIHASRSLRYVNWGSAYTTTMPDHCPWNQLTGITFSSPLTFGQLLRVLSSAPRLEYLRVHSLTSDEIKSGESAKGLFPVTHVHLKAFKFAAEHDIGPLIRHLSTPALQELKLYNKFRGDISRDVTSFRDFLERSHPRELTIFEFEDAHISGNDLQKYLTSPGLRYLRRLRLFVEITDQIVRLLSSVDQQGRHEILPVLEVLDISSDSLKTTDGLLSNMVASRISVSNERPLKTMGLSMSNLGPRDRATFFDMFKEGLAGRKVTNYLDIRYM